MLPVILAATSVLLLLLTEPSSGQPDGKVLIKCASPIACELTLDGEPLGTLAAEGVEKFSVEVGQHLLGTRAADRRFGSHVSEQTITVGPRQTVERVTTLIAVSDLVQEAYAGSVIVKTGRASSFLFTPDRKLLRWKGLEDKLSWGQAGFVEKRFGDVALEPGLTIGIRDRELVGKNCYLQARREGVEFLVSYADVFFVDSKTGVDLSPLTYCPRR